MDYLDKHVKLLLKDNIIIEGIVTSWGKEVILKSPDNKSCSVITHPDEDIRVIKIINTEKENKKENHQTLVVDESLKQKIQDAINAPSTDSLRIKTIAELKKELNKNEKEAIANNLKNINMTDNSNVVRYQYPPFIKK